MRYIIILYWMTLYRLSKCLGHASQDIQRERDTVTTSEAYRPSERIDVADG